MKSHPGSKKKESAMESSSGVTEASDGLWEGELGVDAPPPSRPKPHNFQAPEHGEDQGSRFCSRIQLESVIISISKCSSNRVQPFETSHLVLPELRLLCFFIICPTWDITSRSPPHCRSLKF